jgi:HSP20 family protein
MTAPTQTPDRTPRPVQRWDPLRELADLQERMTRLAEPGTPAPAAWTPPVDIVETDDAWIIEAELPGIDRKDITIELNDNELSISGEIKEKERTGILRRRTRRVGAFDFHVTLPAAVNADEVKAEMHDGVLMVTVPKPQAARRQRIEVK